MKTLLTCVIIDDEDLDRLAVEAELSSFAQIKILESFNNAISALNFVEINKPDIVFLDIDMPEITGVDFVKAISNLNCVIVFITSHPEYALQGFQLKIFDYILKPIESSRFKTCIDRIEEFLQLRGKANAYDVLFENEKIIFKEGHQMNNLNASEVIYLEAYGDYTKIVTAKKAYLTLVTLSNFLESLPKDKFRRIHRSYVVAKSFIASQANKTLTLINGVELPIGKTYLKETKQVFK